MWFSPGLSGQVLPLKTKLPVSFPGKAMVASSPAPLRWYSTLIIPSGCGKVAVSEGNVPRCGAMRTVAKPGLAGSMPATSVSRS